ncbi:MAG: rhomboid family intramembrane serine protease [Bacteroidaceae bacterium]|nr:rhomboid family intramembrane serine protease [Bacteroidaceae bacterium]
MVRGKETKTAALVLTAICLVAYVAMPLPLLQKVGICEDCSILARFAYPFFHASFIHMAINCWCLLSVVFIYDTPRSYIIIAYIIAISFPVGTLSAIVPDAFPSAIPTVGLSGIDYALLGMVSFQVKRKLYYHAWILSFVFILLIFNHLCSFCGYSVATPNNLLHIYCYVAGLLVGFLNSPAHGQAGA